MLKAKVQYLSGNRRPQNAVWGAKSVGLETSIQSSFELSIENDCETLNSSFSPYITEGYLSLVGSKENKPVILRCNIVYF